MVLTTETLPQDDDGWLEADPPKQGYRCVGMTPLEERGGGRRVVLRWEHHSKIGDEVEVEVSCDADREAAAKAFAEEIKGAGDEG